MCLGIGRFSSFSPQDSNEKAKKTDVLSRVTKDEQTSVCTFSKKYIDTVEVRKICRYCINLLRSRACMFLAF